MEEREPFQFVWDSPFLITEIRRPAFEIFEEIVDETTGMLSK